MSKNSNGQVPGLKTPLISDKQKKQQFAMTPDIHTKTYAERSGLGGIASGMGSIGNNIAAGTNTHGPSGMNPHYGNIHQTAKNKNQ
jgi:hypothetical protein